MNDGIQLTIGLHETAKKGSKPLHLWIVEEAKKHGFVGGSVFRSMEDFGHEGKMHKQSFLELGGESSLFAIFVGPKEATDKLLKVFKDEGVSVFVSMARVKYMHT